MSHPRRPTLPVSDWPAADREAWAQAIAEGGPLDDSGPAAHHCARMRADFARCYGYLLRFARERGDLDPQGEPAAVVTPEIVNAYIRDLESRVGSVTRYRYLYKAMRVAEYLAPQRDWRWLRVHTQRLAFAARPRNKRPRVVTTDRIVALGLSLMDRAEQETSQRFRSAATLYRDGLLLVFLALCPLRLSNFTALELGYSIRRLEGVWAVVIPASESKTRRPYEALLPDFLGERLDHFLSIWHPLFPSTNERLWPSRSGGGLTPSAIDYAIRRHTVAAFGRPLSPHLFRDCAATTVAIKAGRQMGTAVALLGHRSSRVIDKHYNQAGMLDAITRYQDLLAR